MSVSSWNQYQWLRNTDRRTGFNFDTSRYLGSRWGILSVICSGTGSCPSSGVSTDYVNNTIEAVPGRSGTLTRALKLALTRQNPNSCCQQVGLSSSGFTSPIRDYYMRAWVRLNPDIQTHANSQGSNYWRQFWVFKTTRDQRIDIKLQNHRAGGITWYVQSDATGANCSPCNQIPYWRHDSRTRAPSRRWFNIEISFHRANDSSGRFFFAVDGRIVVDRRGPNLGYNQDEIAVITHSQVYSSFKRGGWQLVDDLEVRDRPPCTALPCGPPQ